MADKSACGPEDQERGMPGDQRPGDRLRDDQLPGAPKRTKKPEPFRSWAVKRYGKQESERGQLARKIEADPDFPDSMNRNQLALYIYNKGMVERDRMRIFNYVYNQYKTHVLDKCDPADVPIQRKGGLAPGSVAVNTCARNEEISQIISNSLYWFTRPRVETAEECADRLNEFFQHIVETGEIPTIEKMALALGTYTTQLKDWELGRVKVSPGIADMVKRGRQILAAMDAELALTGKIPAIPYIFRSKNFYGMRDQTEVLQVNYDAGANPSDLARMYGEIGQGGAGAIEGEMQE